MLPKFKAWDKSSKRMAMVKSLKGLADGTFNWCILVYKSSPSNSVPINHVELLPYIGSTDFYGKELFKGDIIWVSGFGNCLIDYSDSHKTFTIKTRNCHEIKFTEIIDSGISFKLVGNIYENPELME